MNKIPNFDKIENKEIGYVNTSLPVDNMSLTFIIPPQTSDFSLDISTAIPNHKYFYRYLSDIDYRIDTSGIYNITETQTVLVPGLVPAIRTILPGFYDTSFINTSTLFNDWVQIITGGANAFKAVPASPGPTSIDLTNASQIMSLFGWPTIISSPSTFIPTTTVDITQSKDMLLVYLSICRQASQNNFTNVAAIPLSGTIIGNTVNGTIHQKTPILGGLDTIANPMVRLRDINNNPYLIDTPIILNFKILFSIKNHALGW